MLFYSITEIQDPPQKCSSFMLHELVLVAVILKKGPNKVTNIIEHTKLNCKIGHKAKHEHNKDISMWCNSSSI